MTPLKNDRLLRVLNHLPVDRVPVWMMRQAGRTDPEYKKLRKIDGRPLEKIFSDVETSIKISLLPKKLGVDAGAALDFCRASAAAIVDDHAVGDAELVVEEESSILFILLFFSKTLIIGIILFISPILAP